MSNQEYKQNIDGIIETAIKKEEHSFLGFFIRNYRLTYLLIMAIFLAGLYGMIKMPREADPEVRVPYAMVTTIYSGAAPKDVEDLVTKEIEEKIKNLELMKGFNSNSALGYSSVFIEFEAEADLQESFRKLREAVDSAKPNLPSDAESPVVTELRVNDFPIITYSLVGDYSPADLKNYADILKDRIEETPDVSRVNVVGGIEREILISVDNQRLSNYNLTIGQIVGAIHANNFNMPAGDVEMDGFIYSVRVKGKINDIDDLKNIVVAERQGIPIYLGDLGIVSDTHKEITSESKIRYRGDEQKNSISLQVYKSVNGNILNIVESTKEAVDRAYIQGDLPEDLHVEITNDNSDFIKDDLRILGSSAVQTIFLITAVLLLILSFRGALITSLSLPIAFLISFFFLYIQDMSLNSMVLFSLVLSLGLMVDNTIIITEGINEYVEVHKKSLYQAAILSIWNFKWPIISGTMTTVAAFLPLLLVSGIMGEYLSIIPKTLTVTLLSSLFVALIIIPTLVSRLIKIKPESGHKHRAKKRHVFIAKHVKRLNQRYSEFMWRVLPSKGKRRAIVAGSWILFILAVCIPIFGFMKIEMFPKVDFDYFFVNVELPVGSTLDKTKQITSEVEKVIIEIPELKNYVLNIGAPATVAWGPSGSSGQNKSGFTINLQDAKDRERKSFAIAEDLRKRLANIQGAEVTVDELEAGPPSGDPIEVRIFGSDLGESTKMAEQVKNYFLSQEGVINVKDSLETATGEFVFRIDRRQASFYGLDLATISGAVRGAIFGTKASSINLNNDDVDITVRYNSDNVRSVNDLENLVLLSRNGENITLKQVASLQVEPALTGIQHRDGKNIVTVTAGIEDGVDLQQIMKNFEEYQKTLKLSNGVKLEVGGETEDIEKSFTEMFSSMIVAVILIAFILVMQFNSFRQPFIILFSLPLAIIGVIIGLNLTMQPFSITAFIGVVSLAGIVVNDAIVLIDRMNKNIEMGMEFLDGIIEAGVARMQPIFLTSITTIFGILPLVYANEMWRGLSLTIIFGLIFSTALNLIIVPVMYVGLCKKEKCGQ